MNQYAASLVRLTPNLVLVPPNLELAARESGGLAPPLRVGLQSGTGTPEGAAYRLDLAGLTRLAKGGKRLLIYARRPGRAEAVLRYLRRELPGQGGRLGLYHQDLPAPAKEMAARAWEKGEWQVLVGTPAATLLADAALEKEVALCYPPLCAWVPPPYTVAGRGPRKWLTSATCLLSGPLLSP
jgi:hypothetical protein